MVGFLLLFVFVCVKWESYLVVVVLILEKYVKNNISWFIFLSQGPRYAVNMGGFGCIVSVPQWNVNLFGFCWGVKVLYVGISCFLGRDIQVQPAKSANMVAYGKLLSVIYRAQQIGPNVSFCWSQICTAAIRCSVEADEVESCDAKVEFWFCMWPLLSHTNLKLMWWFGYCCSLGIACGFWLGQIESLFWDIANAHPFQLFLVLFYNGLFLSCWPSVWCGLFWRKWSCGALSVC